MLAEMRLSKSGCLVTLSRRRRLEVQLCALDPSNKCSCDHIQAFFKKKWNVVQTEAAARWEPTAEQHALLIEALGEMRGRLDDEKAKAVLRQLCVSEPGLSLHFVQSWWASNVRSTRAAGAATGAGAGAVGAAGGEGRVQKKRRARKGPKGKSWYELHPNAVKVIFNATAGVYAEVAADLDVADADVAPSVPVKAVFDCLKVTQKPTVVALKLDVKRIGTVVKEFREHTAAFANAISHLDDTTDEDSASGDEE